MRLRSNLAMAIIHFAIAAAALAMLVAHEQALAHEIEHLLNWRGPEKYQHPHRR
jgi:hypothetical protein